MNNENKHLIKKVALLLSVIFFILGLSYSLYTFPLALNDLQYVPLLLVMFIGVPLTIAIHAYEYLLSARISGKKALYRSAVEMTVIANAANMLPLPGGTIVRVAGLKSLGVTIRDGTTINLVIGIIWIGIALIYSGLWMMLTETENYPVIFLSLGIPILVISFLFFAYRYNNTSDSLMITLTRTFMLLLESARLYLCFHGLSIDASFAQSSSLSLSTVLGSAVSIVPAGLGVREAAASVLSSMVGLSLASGFLTSALNRILGMIIVLPIATLLSRKSFQK